MKGEKETSWGVTFEPKVQQTMNGFPRRTKYCCNTNNICANNAAFPGIEYPDPMTGDNMINAYFNEFRVNKAAAHAQIAAQISTAFGGFFGAFGSAN